MANFVEIVRAARLITGMQGTGPSTVETAQGIEEVLVRFVRDAYMDIQSLRDNFDFLENSRSFFTAVGTTLYTPATIFLTATPNFKSYKKGSIYITRSDGIKEYLKYVEPQVLEARYLNNTVQATPSEYTIDPATNGLILQRIPNAIYTVSFRYYERPEILLSSTQIPKMPQAFHNLIVYKAVEKMAIYLNNPGLYQSYSVEAARMVGQLMRQEIAKKRMKTGAFA
jgi:hypothetical protein